MAINFQVACGKLIPEESDDSSQKNAEKPHMGR